MTERSEGAVGLTAGLDGWMPIAEAPRDGTRILAVENFRREDEDGAQYPEDWAVVRWVEGKHGSGWVAYGLLLASFAPTHWRSLPALPSNAEVSGGL